jgi:hypothetical protein
VLLLLSAATNNLRAQVNGPLQPKQGTQPKTAASDRTDDTPSDVLPPEEWRRVDAAVERGLAFLATHQQPDGSFRTIEQGQPGVTSLCMMAFIAHGHVPGDGKYGKQLERAANFVLSCQKPCGLVVSVGQEGPTIDRNVNGGPGTTAAYNHAISSLLLSEYYGMSQPPKSEQIKKAINKALAATLQMQRWSKDLPEDRGGWRYITDVGLHDSDLSITGWNLMFLRSARNAGFDVPREPIDDAIKYIRRTYKPKLGRFTYTTGRDSNGSRGMSGAGILALAHAGFHNSPEAQSAGAWVLSQTFEPYNKSIQFNSDRTLDHYHYAVFSCCQGMYQLGGGYWEKFFPRIVPILLANQQADGSWPPDSQKWDAPYGSDYTTALMVMSLGASNQLLPIFQR